MSTRTRAHLRSACALALAVAALTVASPRTAAAWDPTAIHVPLTERAALESDLQIRWMEASDGAFGLFSGVRLDPSMLTVAERVVIAHTLSNLPGSSGARPLGGPGACPPPGSPEQTQRFCVAGDLWELDALGWIRLGVFAESSPPTRISRHFVYAADSASAEGVTNAAGVVSRRSNRQRDASALNSFIGLRATNETASARAWYDDTSAPLAPRNLARHLEFAATAETTTKRQHHLAMALICAGALSHVLQDISLPAHARGDVDAFFRPLSRLPGDRGLPMQEWARVHIGRSGVYALPAGDDFATADLSLRGLFFHPIKGAAAVTRSEYFSESTLPAAAVLDPSLSKTDAASQLLEDADIGSETREGAALTAWPADSGYLQARNGRVLFAWRRGLDGVVTPFLDADIFRAEASSILPRAMSATSRALELLFPRWPGRDDTIDQGILSFQLPAGLVNARALVSVQDEFGTRGPPQLLDLRTDGPQRLVGLPIPSATHSTSVTFIAEREGGGSYVASRLFERTSPAADEQ